MNWEGLHKTLSTRDMIVYVENPKEETKKNLLELPSEYSEAAERKVIIQKPTTFLHTSTNKSNLK